MLMIVWRKMLVPIAKHITMRDRNLESGVGDTGGGDRHLAD